MAKIQTGNFICYVKLDCKMQVPLPSVSRYEKGASHSFPASKFTHL